MRCTHDRRRRPVPKPGETVRRAPWPVLERGAPDGPPLSDGVPCLRNFKDAAFEKLALLFPSTPLAGRLRRLLKTGDGEARGGAICVPLAPQSGVGRAGRRS